jgi:hypothetical protein
MMSHITLHDKNFSFNSPDYGVHSELGNKSSACMTFLFGELTNSMELSTTQEATTCAAIQ